VIQNGQQTVTGRRTILFIRQLIYESAEPWWNDIDREKLKKILSKSQCYLYIKIPHGLTRG
jgi:hypothetical protein